MQPSSYCFRPAEAAGTPVPLLYCFDLQLFAGEEKTEPATPHRRQEARRKGQVFHSVEFNAAASLLTASLTVFLVLPLWRHQLATLTQDLLLQAPDDWTLSEAYGLFIQVLLRFLLLTAPVLFATLVSALLASYLQVGFVFSLEPVALRLDRLDPVSGLQRLFSRRSLAVLARSLIKLVLVGWVALSSIRSEFARFPQLSLMGLDGVVAFGRALTWRLLWQSGLVVLLLALFDYAYQRWEYEQGLRMSQQEVKEEFKQTEGSPEIRAKVRERQRQLARARMLHRVPEADVVITNPTHYAVALEYKAGRMPAPRVIAKGAGLVAERIKRIARAHGVSVVENKPLAQALYRTVEVGDSIPATLYRAVAEVLAYVYRQRGLV
ncbi:MAG TPA: flagellar biosynthesis protein FlhB [Firmicutes bacterium]|nr:flagellar biosynthesis protein FlhB [Bacillota bacterium]